VTPHAVVVAAGHAAGRSEVGYPGHRRSSAGTAASGIAEVLVISTLRLGIVFLVIALVAAFLGYGGVAAYSWEGARILLVVFIILALLSLVMHGFRRRPFWG